MPNLTLAHTAIPDSFSGYTWYTSAKPHNESYDALDALCRLTLAAPLLTDSWRLWGHEPHPKPLLGRDLSLPCCWTEADKLTVWTYRALGAVVVSYVTEGFVSDSEREFLTDDADDSVA